MKRFVFGRYVLSGFFVAAMLAGCGALPVSLSKGQDDTQPAIGEAPAHAIRLGRTSSHISGNTPRFRILYRFKSGIDAQVPEADLIAVSGVLYGTTVSGGESGCEGGGGCGTAYKLTLTGSQISESVIYNVTEGFQPAAALLAVGDVLYGTTENGGQYSCYFSCGTLFQLSPSGSTYAPSILHYFQSDSGSNPTAPLIEARGRLYGTASDGGSGNGGVVYELGGAGSKYRVIHSFEGGRDGANPYAGLLDFNGSLYGTTGTGGSANVGVVYELRSTADGYKERVVYSFKGGKDGSNPDTALIALHGVLYGTTSEGGGGSCSKGAGCGTVYKLTPAQSAYTESVIYRFRGGRDGRYPDSVLTAFRDGLFGTTIFGGNSSCAGGEGCGTIFELGRSGNGYRERVLHRFKGGADGYSPEAGLTAMNGSLYGTTAFGGNLRCNYGEGCGTIFSIEP